MPIRKSQLLRLRDCRSLVALLLAITIVSSQFAITQPFRVNAIASSGPISEPESALSSVCLSPSSFDISVQQVQPGQGNETISGHVVEDIKSGKAQFKSQMSSSFTLRMEIVFNIRNIVQFQKCLDSINNPTSPDYQEFLNATTLEPYLPTPGQKSSVASFLAGRGFTVVEGASPLVLEVSATVRIVQSVLGVTVGVYAQNGGPNFYGVNSDPELPTNFAPLVNAIVGLDNYTQIEPAESPCSGPYCPQGVQVGYALTNLYSADFDGTGQKVAIVDAPGDNNTQSAIDTFDTYYGLPSITLDIRYPDGTPSTWNAGWASEAAMDVEAVHSVAPGAGIVLLYDTGDLMNSVDYVATNHVASIVSNSWTYACVKALKTYSCSDTQLTPSLVMSVDSRLALDVAQGLTILFASGDQGSKPDGTNLGTEFPASDPNVLAVGATNLVLAGCGSSTCLAYGSETGASISGGGYSGFFAESAWQSTTIGPTSGRAVPDVAMFGYSPNFWVYSTSSDKCGRGGKSAGWFSCAGTSLSTPLWAGFLAIALQLRSGAAFGNVGPRLYSVADSTSYSADMHDIISGSNGYPAVAGWDNVTGWGTPIADHLALDLAGLVSFYTNPTTFVGASSPGSIIACGGTFTDSQSSPNCSSSFSATANLPSPSPDWQFFGWEWAGSVSCSSSTANPTSCTLAPGSGSLKAVYLAKVTFLTTPSNGGMISWGSCANPGYTNGQAAFNQTLPPEFSNSILVCAHPTTNAPFGGWNCSAGLSCSSANATTTVTFSGPGSVTASFGIATAFDFRLSNSATSSNSGGITVAHGNSGSISITVSLVNGPTQTVTLFCSSANGLLPLGVSCSPANGSPPFTSSLTITTSSSTPAGNYTIKVTGTANGLNRITIFTLTVT